MIWIVYLILNKNYINVSNLKLFYSYEFTFILFVVYSFVVIKNNSNVYFKSIYI